MTAGAALEYHRRTKHSPESLRSNRWVLDFSNQPLPFKRYPGLEPIPLPSSLPATSVPATEVLSGLRPASAADLDLAGLARLLYYSAGAVRPAGSRGMRYFRAAPSAGALYPVEVYVVAGGVDGLEPGVYHFSPEDYALRRLRDGDHRAVLAEASADPALNGAPASLVLTGIPWRTTWKYRDRGYRHLFWDAGTMLANTLAVAAASGWPAQIVLAFADRAVATLVDVGFPEEFPLAVIAVGSDGPGEAMAGGELSRAALAVEPLSPHPIEFPLLADTHAAGDLAGPGDVAIWRAAAAKVGEPAAETPLARPDGDSDDNVEAVILRRGSTRRFARRPVPAEVLEWGVAVAAQPVPTDFSRPGTTLIDHLVAVHAVEGWDAGAHRFARGAWQQLHEGDFRDLAAALCLGQPLGGDGAFTDFLAADVEAVAGHLGARGYRAAQLEAGVAAGRLHLAAYALGAGATGLTFFDDEVAAFFETSRQPMLTVAVGPPAYRARPGLPPPG